MLNHRTHANFAALAGALALALLSPTLSMAQDATTPFPILVPCGSATAHHAIVPDASGCQQISPTGAFSIAALASLASDPNIRIGFSATADCKQTYTPKNEELVKMMQSGSCTVFAVADEHKGGHKGVEKLANAGHGPAKPITARAADEDHPPGTSYGRDGPDPDMQHQKLHTADFESVQNFYKGFFIKKRDNTNGGSGGEKKGSLETDGATAAAQTRLTYVMLVNTQQQV